MENTVQSYDFARMVFENTIKDKQRLLNMPESVYQKIRANAIQSGVSEDEFLLVDECRRMGNTKIEGKVF